VTPARRVATGIAGGAALVAGVTVIARVVGFVRQLVFQATVGQTPLGEVYTTANYVPNILFEVVAGGALAGVVVPLLARAAVQGDDQRVRRTSGALVGWSLVVLVPVALVGAVLARPVMTWLLGTTAGPEAVELGTRMLLVFLPQVPAYGLAVVSAGVLQAHRRFLAAAAAPVVSSLVVATAYLAYGVVASTPRDDVGALPRREELLLSVGTTLGVFALAATTLVPAVVRGWVGRPRLRFPGGVARRARGLAASGLAVLLAQQLTMVVVLRLSNDRGETGAIVTFQNSWMVYLLPYAVLAVPIATSAFPRLSDRAEAGAEADYARVASATTRAVVLVSAVGAAVLAASSWPVARFFALIGQGEVPAAEMARALLAFAPGLVGYGLVAHLGRALYARGAGRQAAVATVAGWAVVVLTDLVLTGLVPADWTVAALGLGNTVGMTVAGILLVWALRRSAGGAALGGLARTTAAAAGAAVVGGALGLGLARWVPSTGAVGTLVTGLLVATCSAAVAVAVAAVADRRTLRAVLDARRRRAPAEGEGP
jgi:putative peptidoglycan lipid II flippase